jgi:histidinol-phosphate aminotransferase
MKPGTSTLLDGFSRRSFLKLSGAASAAIALNVSTEIAFAQAAEPEHSGNAVMINRNENPLGPTLGARQAAASILTQGGRYRGDLTAEFTKNYADFLGIKPEYVKVFPGSSGPLHYAILAFCSPKRSFVMGDPGYEAGTYAAKAAGARLVAVPLTSNYSHDVKAMLAAAPDAGLFYICTPNNPTGTLTSHSDIEYLVEKKPAGSVVMIDEAYLHFCDGTSAMDLVMADKDVIVLRTFSKIYGMAGLRCGAVVARPDMLTAINARNGYDLMPITAVAAAAASIKDPDLVPQRRNINTALRESMFEWMSSNGYKYIPSQTNFFLVDTKRPAKDAIEAMALQDVVIGRSWPIMPNYARITIGTRPEMEKFKTAFKNVMDGKAMG